jgi:hypothetical protein
MVPSCMTLREASEVPCVSYWRAAELARTGDVTCCQAWAAVRVHPQKLAEFIDRGGQALPGGWRRRPREAEEAAREGKKKPAAGGAGGRVEEYGCCPQHTTSVHDGAIAAGLIACLMAARRRRLQLAR